MDTLMGRWPIATAETLPHIIRELSIRKYDFLEDPIPLDRWFPGASEQERREAIRFAPMPFACRMQLPNGSRGAYFWGEYKNHMTVFVLVEGMVLLTLEYKPGIDTKRITVVPISGVPCKKDAPRGDENEREKMDNCVRREFGEEVGLMLGNVEFLGEVQKANAACYRYRGQILEPFQDVPMNRDRLEYMAIIAMPLTDWLTVCRRGTTEHYCIEALADSVTHTALSTPVTR
jgi:NUDIX domain-containing protein